MENGASEKDFGKDLGLVHEAVIAGRKIGAGRPFWKRIAHNPAFFEKVIEISRIADWHDEIDAAVNSSLPKGIFIDPKLQVEKVMELNDQYSMGFTKEEFASLGEPHFGWLGRMVMPVVFLEFFPREGLLDNFQFLWYKLIQHIYPTGLLHHFSLSADFLKPWEGAVFERGLRWRAVDVGEIPKIPEPVQEIRLRNPPENLLHLGALCMAILFPEWTKNLGIKFPRVALPGIQTQKRNHVWTRSRYRKHDGTAHPCFIPVLSNERSVRYGSEGMFLEMFELLELDSQGFTAIPVFQPTR